MHGARCIALSPALERAPLFLLPLPLTYETPRTQADKRTLRERNGSGTGNIGILHKLVQSPGYNLSPSNPKGEISFSNLPAPLSARSGMLMHTLRGMHTYTSLKPVETVMRHRIVEPKRVRRICVGGWA